MDIGFSDHACALAVLPISWNWANVDVRGAGEVSKKHYTSVGKAERLTYPHLTYLCCSLYGRAEGPHFSGLFAEACMCIAIFNRRFLLPLFASVDCMFADPKLLSRRKSK